MIGTSDQLQISYNRDLISGDASLCIRLYDRRQGNYRTRLLKIPANKQNQGCWISNHIQLWAIVTARLVIKLFELDTKVLSEDDLTRMLVLKGQALVLEYEAEEYRTSLHMNA